MDVQNRWHRWLVVAIVAAVALGLTLAAFAYSRSAEFEVARARHEGAAQTRVVQTRHQLSEATAIIESMGDVARVHPRFSGEDFYAYGELALSHHPMLFSFMWTEWVPHDRREAVVQAMRDDGYDVPDLLAREEGGQVTSAPQREHYLVVRHFAPQAVSENFVGVDAMSLPGRPGAVRQAIDTGEVTATPPVWVSPEAPPSVIVGVPIYNTVDPPPDVQSRRENVIGIVALGFIPQPMLSQAMAEQGPPLQRTVVLAEDLSGESHVVMFDSLADGLVPAQDVSLNDLVGDPLAVVEQVSFAGRDWQVVTTPTPAFDALWRRDPTPWVVLGTGLAMTLLVATLVGGYLRHDAWKQRQAEERSRTAAELARRVAEQEKTQSALGHANRELMELNDEMEQFVSAVSHDLKNPLAAAEMLCAAAAKAFDRDRVNEAREATERLGDAMGMMRRIIDDLLEHSRAGFSAFHGELVDLDELVRTVMKEHEAEAVETGATLRVNGRLPRIYGDRGRLAAVIGNLVGNAVRYGCGGRSDRTCEVTVACERVRREQGGEAWRLYVRDNGPGVPPEARERIFRIFERLSADERGTGIGLAIVERAARAHGGHVWVEDTPGGGATFCVELPRDREAEADADAQPEHADEQPETEVVVNAGERSASGARTNA